MAKKQKPLNSTGIQTIHPVSDQLYGSDNQLREIRPNSISNFHFYRNGISYICQHFKNCWGQLICSLKNLLYQTGFFVSCGTDPYIAKLCNARTVISGDHRTFLTSPDQVVNRDCASPQLVEAGRALSSRCTSEDGSSLSYDLYGCQPFGWGAHVEPEGLLLHGAWT